MLHSPPSIADRSEQPYISTGHLPEPELVQRLVSEAHVRFKSNTEGQSSQVYPALARARSDLFGVCVVGTSGRVYAAGEVDHPFSIMAGLAFVTIIPASRLPSYRPGELPTGQPARR
jgi:glutaminase